MNLRQVKDTLKKAGFSAESSKIVNEILDEAIKRGHITQREKDKLLGIIDIEIETANLEAGTMEEVALLLESFANEVDKATEKAKKEIEEVDNKLLTNL